MLKQLTLLTSFVAVHGHGHMTKPRPRPPLWAEPSMTGHTSETADYRWREPPFTLNGPMTHSSHAYRADSYACHDFASESPQTTLTAGASLDLEWVLEARHPGDCALYISYDENTDVPTSWIKLGDFPGCVDQATFPTFDGVAPPQDNKWTLTLPSWLPSSDHAVLRWEWMAVQQVVNVEFYTTCADVKIVGTSESTADFLSKVSPVVAAAASEDGARAAAAVGGGVRAAPRDAILRRSLDTATGPPCSPCSCNAFTVRTE